MNPPSFTGIWRYLLVFILLEAFIFFLLGYNKKEQLNRHYRTNIQELSSQYESVFLEYQKLSEAVFYSVIDNNSTKAILKKSLEDEKYEAESRRKLTETMLPVYQRLKDLGLKQFQFHMPDNTSFLRLHELGHYGDTLLSFRHTVSLVNRDKKPVFAFEEGRAASGFRYVFPIMQGENHLGSVEFGIDYEAIMSSLQSLSGARYALIVKKDALGKPDMFAGAKRSFAPFAICDDYLLEGQDKREFREIEGALDAKSKVIKNKCTAQRPFCLPVEIGGETYTVSFYPIKDIRRVHTAYLIEYKKDPAYAFYRASFIRTFGVYTLFMSVLLTVIYLINKKRQNIWELSNSLRRKSEEMEAVLEASGGGLAILDEKGRFLYANTAFCSKLEYEKDEIMGLDIFALCVDAEYQSLKEAIDEALISGASYNIKKTLVSKRDNGFIFSIQITRMPDGHSLILSANDITEDVEYAKTLEHKASIDELTGVLNRRSIEAMLMEAAMNAKNTDKPLSVVVMDIDNFKSINDTYGHQIGDSVLKEFARIVEGEIRTSDIFGRWGGEEFVLICYGTNAKNALLVAEKIRASVEAKRIEGLPAITSSFGIAELMVTEGWDELFVRADQAMYRAKQSGKNRVEISD